ncbi:arylamine N-acetyltransferase 1-like isoform X2 [Scyliorhinus canicula]|uniref:arylamine N-acetyltransferase 1-like isoform X2 n=1 Tax=Scyliorhinus canicula TaxID=7830 RepID=UPI0018F3913B|nr:arylamine N-acetyltransferase 1-like isoform X2 [Scyliorhinus canicula]
MQIESEDVLGGPYKKPDLETLSTLLENHVTSIPYENLGTLCGEEIVLNMETVFDKMVRKNRGGCCLEHNGLFHWVLKEMGYNVKILATRLYKLAKEKYESHPSHGFLLVTIDTKNYVADVGFLTSYQMRRPLELVSGKEQTQLPGTYRLTEDNSIWYLDKVKRKLCIVGQNNDNQSQIKQLAYQKVLCFTLKPCRLEDFEGTMDYLINSPMSFFTSLSLTCFQTTNGFKILKGTVYWEQIFNVEDGVDLRTSRTLTDEEVQRVIKKTFNLNLDKKIIPVNNFTNFLLE